MSNPTQAPADGAPMAAPWHLLLLVAACTMAVAAIVLTRPCLNDEAYYLEPGINLLNGRGFVSGFGWPNDLSVFWGSSTPGMSLVYAAWFWLVGFGFLQSKLLSLVIHLLGVLGVVRWASRRYQLAPAGVAILVILLVGLPSMVANAGACRPDVFGLLFTAGFLCVFLPSCGEERVNPAGAVLLGLALVAVALHHAFYFSLLAAGLFLIKRTRVRFLNGAYLALGMAVAVAVIYKVYAANGAWDDFMAARKWHYDPANRAFMPWVARGLGVYTVAFDMLLLGLFAAGLAAAAAKSWLKAKKDDRQPMAALGVFLAVPVALSSAGVFYREYAWMVVVPMLLLLLPRIVGLWNRAAGRWLPALVLAAAAALSAAAMWRVGVNRNLAREVDSSMQTLLSAGYNGEPAVIRPEFYYPMKARCRDLYMSLYPYWPQSGEWPPSSRSSIRWVVGLDPARLGPGFGGHCERVGPTSSDPVMFQVWRRVP